MTDNTYEQTNYFCLAMKYPEGTEFEIEGSVLYKDTDRLKVAIKDLEREMLYERAEKKIFHFKLVGEVE